MFSFKRGGVSERKKKRCETGVQKKEKGGCWEKDLARRLGESHVCFRGPKSNRGC